MSLPPCPKCGSTLTCEDGALPVCPECAHQWAPGKVAADEPKVVRDPVGNPLADGDTVTVFKDLKVKGGSLVLKRGTKAKNIRLVDGDHHIDRKIYGVGAGRLLITHAMELKGALELGACANNQQAYAFYGRLGFREVSRRPADDHGLTFENARMQLTG